MALIVFVVLASTWLANPWSHAATTSPTGLPLYQFVDSSSGVLPWNALSLEGSIDHTTMVGGPHAASDATEGVLAYRTNKGDLALFTQGTTAPSTWTDLSTANNLPAPAADPIPFFDPAGNVDLLYVDTFGHLLLLSANDPTSALWHHAHRGEAWRPYVTTDLTNLSGVVAASGLASIQVSGLSATVAYRTLNDNVEVALLDWSAGEPVPMLSGAPVDVTGNPTTSTTPTTTTTRPVTTTTRAPTTTTTRPVTTTTRAPATTTTKPVTTTTVVGTGTTTTTKPVTTTTKAPTTTTTTTTTTTVPSTGVVVASDPIVLPGTVPAFATISNAGDLEVYTDTGPVSSTWSVLDVTSLTLAPKVTHTLAMGFNATSIELAALTSGGAVELFTTPLSSFVAGAKTAHLLTVTPPTWSVLDVTGAAPGAPPLSGSIFLDVTPTQVSIAGQAANWGDLFTLANAQGSPTWTSTDVSVTAGSSARTVGDVVAGIQTGSALTLYAAGVSSPPPEGVGVYAIPSAKWAQAISDGWPIVSETGGLGTQSAPWVGFTSTTNVASSPDFLMGQSIYNSHKRVTWLSFWTVSGPLKAEPHTAATYYSHGFAAGAWVASQIDQYRSLGVGLKPDWVIFDPEGYPDNHSGLDAPGGSSAATLVLYATYWSAMLSGWASGIASVDPSLNAGVYASQSEYSNYSLATESMPVFVAVAFGNGGPVPVAGASGSNIRGFISFSASCTPTSTLASEESTLLNPPWAGQFNTLQFNAGVYCPPAQP